MAFTEDEVRLLAVGLEDAHDGEKSANGSEHEAKENVQRCSARNHDVLRQRAYEVHTVRCPLVRRVRIDLLAFLPRLAGSLSDHAAMLWGGRSARALAGRPHAPSSTPPADGSPAWTGIYTYTSSSSGTFSITAN